MCGLFGWYLKKALPKHSMRSLARSLLRANDTRGGDSWGWYGVESGHRFTGLGRSARMKGRTFAALTSELTVIGHTRKATTGTVKLSNCHPFLIGGLVGAHNGIVFNHAELNWTYERNCAVDSEHLFHHLDEERDLSDIEAYGAITWHAYERPDTPIFFGTFSGGEFCWLEFEEGAIWSSDYQHLKASVTRAGLSGKLWHPEEGWVYCLDRDGEGWQCGELDVGAPKWGVSWADRAATGSSASAYPELDEVDIWDLLTDEEREKAREDKLFGNF